MTGGGGRRSAGKGNKVFEKYRSKTGTADLKYLKIIFSKVLLKLVFIYLYLVLVLTGLNKFENYLLFFELFNRGLLDTIQFSNIWIDEI